MFSKGEKQTKISFHLGSDGRIILKLILNRIQKRWLNSSGSG